MLDVRLAKDAVSMVDAFGRPGSADGRRVLELPKSYYYRRTFDYVTMAPPGWSPGLEFQHLDGEAEFSLRSLQYAITETTIELPMTVLHRGFTLRFPNGRILTLPPSAADFLDSAGRIDLTGSSSAELAGGITLAPCDRLAIDVPNCGDPKLGPNGGYGTVAVRLDVSILFTGVLRYHLPADSTPRRPYPAPGGGPRALFTANQNIVAPETARGFQCYPETPEGYRDIEFHVISDELSIPFIGGGGVTVPLSPEIGGSVTVPGDGAFVWRGFDWLVTRTEGYGGNPALGIPINVAARFRTMDGQDLSEDLIDLFAMTGPIFPEVVLPAGSRLFYDAAVEYCEATGANVGSVVTIRMVLHGVKRIRL